MGHGTSWQNFYINSGHVCFSFIGPGSRAAISGKNLRVKQPYLHNVESTLDELVKVVSDEDEDDEDDDEEAEVTEGPGEASDGGGHGGDSETEVTS